jgi:hypothetical protein
LVDYYEDPDSLLLDFFSEIINKKREREDETKYDGNDYELDNLNSATNENQTNMEVIDMYPNDQNDHERTGNLTKVESETQIRCKSKFDIYLKRYDSFIKSPRVHFVYDTVFYTTFLLLFSYIILCDLTYYQVTDNEKSSNESNTLNETLNNFTGMTKSDEYFEQKIIKAPSSLEYLLAFWIFSFICEEFSQVCILN